MTDSSLFPEFERLREGGGVGPFAAVAIERNLDRVLDYGVSRGLAAGLKVGQRVRVPLGRGNKAVHGYVVAIKAATECRQVKDVLAIDDPRVLLSPVLLELARWMSRYYCCALGTVLESVIPSAVKKRIGLGYTLMVRPARPREEIQAILEKTRAPKRRAILSKLLLIEPGQEMELGRLAGEAGATAGTVRKLAKMGLIVITEEPDFSSLGKVAPGPAATREQPIELNEDQQKVYDELAPRVTGGGFSVNLLYGVTGSGKTEVYLQCIRDVIAKGKRAIVLVPEIALTPQTARRFTARFAHVAILHSSEADSVRHRFWQQALTGQANVVVGTRSAIFAPFPNLGIIIVDEEHETSYKSWDKPPYYHAREVAIKRAQIEQIPLILGSATPSLESYWRATRSGKPSTVSDPGVYHLLSLPRRVRGLQMPHVETVDMKREAKMHRPGVHLISQRLSHLLRTTMNDGHQAILLLNRRGHSSFVYCASCGHVLRCKFCDATMIYHRFPNAHATGASFNEAIHTGELRCHYHHTNKYEKTLIPLPLACPDCGKKLSLFGMGTQRVEEELVRRFPGVTFARVDTDSMRRRGDYEAVFERFERGEIQVLLGTQLVAKGLDFPNVTLVGVINADTVLALPDFRAAERTFQLITQVAGRAGRGDAPGRVIVQTFLPDDPAIQAALKGDYQAFALRELRAREELGLPPVTRMVRIILRDQDPDRLVDLGEELAAALLAAMLQENAQEVKITLKGPMPCAMNRIKGYHRAQLLLFARNAGVLPRVLTNARAQKAFADNDRVVVDVDPVALL